MFPFERTRPYDVGILLVHGIGTQRKGDTLLEAGSALVDVLQARLLRLVPGRPSRFTLPTVELEAAHLHGDEPGVPARAEIRLNHIDGLRWPGSPHDKASTSSWLIAESWWAESFPEPSSVEVLKWTIDILPASIASHFGRRARRAWFEFRDPDNQSGEIGQYIRLATAVATLLVALVLVPPGLCALVLFLLFGLLPIPFAESLARILQRFLAATVGDSYMLLGKRLARAAIVDTVRRDTRWLAERCDHVAVVAHSQGAAIAHEVLRSYPLTECELLVTYGSGLQKLSLIERMKKHQGQCALLWIAIASFFSAWAIPLVAVISIPALAVSAAIPALGAFAIGSLALMEQLRRSGGFVAHEKQWEADRQLFADRYRLPNERIEWMDIYAGDDPIPNGPLLDEYDPRTRERYSAGGQGSTNRIQNLGSLLLDHTTYWGNRDEFVSLLARRFLSLAGISTQSLDADENDQYQAAAERRRWRVAWRHVGTMIGLGTTAALAIRLYANPPRVASHVYELVGEFVHAIPRIGEWLAPRTELSFHTPLGVALICLLYALVLSAVRSLWGAWNEEEMDISSRGGTYSNSTLRFTVYWLILLSTLVAATIYSFGVTALYGAVAVVAIGGSALVSERFGCSSLLASVRARTAGGTLAEVRARWKLSEQEALERNAKKGHRRGLYEMGRERVRSDSPEDQAKGETALRRALELGMVGAGWVLGDYLQHTKKDLEGARKAYEKGMRLGDPVAAYFLARLLEDELHDKDAALQVYAEATFELQDPVAARRLGLLLEGVGKFKDAQKAYKRGSELNDGPSAAKLGDLYLSAARRREKHQNIKTGGLLRDAAIRQFWLAISLGDERSAGILAIVLCERDDAFAAIAACEAGIRLGSASSALQLGQMFVRQGHPSEAERALKRALEMTELKKINGQSAEAHTAVEAAWELGQLVEARGDRAGARLLYRIAIGNPGAREGSSKAAVWLGCALIEEGNREDAEFVLRRGLELGSMEAGVYLAAALFEQTRVDEALNAYDQAAAKEQNWTSEVWGQVLTEHDAAPARKSILSSAYTALGAHFYFYGDSARAKDAYLCGAQHGSEQAIRVLVNLAIDVPDLELARKLLDKCYWLPVDARLKLARLFKFEGYPDLALQLASQIIPVSAEHTLGFGQLYEELGDRDTALRMYESAMESGSGEAALSVAKLYREFGDSYAVRRAIRKAQILGYTIPGAAASGEQWTEASEATDHNRPGKDKPSKQSG